MFLSSVLQPTKSHTYLELTPEKISPYRNNERQIFIYLFIKLKPLNNVCVWEMKDIVESSLSRKFGSPALGKRIVT